MSLAVHCGSLHTLKLPIDITVTDIPIPHVQGIFPRFTYHVGLPPVPTNVVEVALFYTLFWPNISLEHTKSMYDDAERMRWWDTVIQWQCCDVSELSWEVRMFERVPQNDNSRCCERANPIRIAKIDLVIK